MATEVIFVYTKGGDSCRSFGSGPAVVKKVWITAKGEEAVLRILPNASLGSHGKC
jgi:hypothetical protein